MRWLWIWGAGVRVRPLLVSTYALTGVLVGLGACFTIAMGTSTLDQGVGAGRELAVIAAVVIGGTLLTGGYGFVAGTFLGVMLQGLVQTYIVFDGSLSSWWTKIVIGALLFMFIVLQRLIFTASAPRRKVLWKT